MLKILFMLIIIIYKVSCHRKTITKMVHIWLEQYPNYNFANPRIFLLVVHVCEDDPRPGMTSYSNSLSVFEQQRMERYRIGGIQADPVDSLTYNDAMPSLIIT